MFAGRGKFLGLLFMIMMIVVAFCVEKSHAYTITPTINGDQFQLEWSADGEMGKNVLDLYQDFGIRAEDIGLIDGYAINASGWDTWIETYINPDDGFVYIRGRAHTDNADDGLLGPRTYTTTLDLADSLGDLNDYGTMEFEGRLDGAGFLSPEVLLFNAPNIYDSAPVPEPASIILLGAGLLGLAGVTRNRKS